MKIALMLATLILLICIGAGLHHWLAPESRAVRQISTLLEQFETAMATQEASQVSAFLQAHLTEDATVKLVTSISALGLRTGSPISTMNFDKPGFIAFMDGTVSSMDEYDVSARLEDLSLSDDGNIATIKTLMRAKGSGVYQLSRSKINADYVLVINCDSRAMMDADPPKLQHAQCDIGLKKQPKIGNALTNPAQLHNERLKMLKP